MNTNIITNDNVPKAPSCVGRFKKGDTFVTSDSDSSLTFMVINEVQDSNEYMDFCLVTWYTMDTTGPHIQRRFPMVARDGMFSGFVPIPRRRYHEAVKAMRQYGADVKNIETPSEIKSQYSESNRKLTELAKNYL